MSNGAQVSYQELTLGTTFLIDIKSGKVAGRCPKSMSPPEHCSGGDINWGQSI